MIFHDIAQNSEEWEALRVGKVTSSNYPAIMANDGKDFGPPAMAYALQVALGMITGRSASGGYTNAHMERGHEQEPIARMMYEAETFSSVYNGGFFDHGRWGCSPDGLVGKDGLLEVKSVIASTHYATMRRGSFDPAYRWQLIGNIEGTGRKWIDFTSFCSEFPDGQQTLIYRLERGSIEQEIEALIARRALFLQLVDDIKSSLLAA